MTFDASQYVKSRWLHGSDLQPGQVLTLTIREAVEHQFDDGTKRPVVKFFEVEQALALNKTQVGVLIGLFGANAGDWIAQRVELMATPSSFAGKPTILIRKAPATMPTFNGQQMGQPPAPAPQAQPAPSPQAADDLWETPQRPAAGDVTFR